MRALDRLYQTTPLQISERCNPDISVTMLGETARAHLRKTQLIAADIGLGQDGLGDLLIVRVSLKHVRCQRPEVVHKVAVRPLGREA